MGRSVDYYFTAQSPWTYLGHERFTRIARAAGATVNLLPTDYGNTNPPRPALTFGDAPWAPSEEVLNGVLRGIQIYYGLLSLQDITSELASPRSTSAGASNIWYLNLNPTPSDISDKSGKGHNPSWVGSERPTLW